ncbi:MAG TPA: lytic transglycosylase domain-containing protein [Thermoanaerobaculia bacterium]|nr:lytic transglycosylase domain-containing protein [Thermoanaerobaculia bacterium]
MSLFLVPALAAAEVGLRQGPGGRVVISNQGVVEARGAVPARLRPIDPELELVVDEHCSRHELEPKLVRALIQVESAWNPAAVSHKGAVGLMQLMPGTAAQLAVSDPYDADQNIRGGTAYLRRMIDRFDGRVDLALAAYNAGPKAVERFGGIPPYAETRAYVRRILGLYEGPELIAVKSPPAGAVRGAKTILVLGAGERPLLTTARLAPR